MLASQTAPAELEEKIFEIVNQLNRGVALITSHDEREQVAQLNLIAGKRAKAATAYASALNYFATGEALLVEDRWGHCHALTFDLAFHRAECEFLTGELAAAEERLSMLSRRTGSLVNRAAVTCLRLNLYTTLDRTDRAVQVGLEYLQHVGVEWTPQPTKEQVGQEYELVWRQLGSRTIEALIDLPPMNNVACQATLDVLTGLLPPATFTDENLLCLVVGRMANLSLEHGNCDGSCLAYVWLGTILGSRLGDNQAAFRFGKVGLDLMEQRGLDRFKARVYVVFAHLVIPWTRHLHSGRALVRRALVTALETGDLTYAAYSYDRLVTFLLATDDPLDEIQRDAENGLEFARKARFGLIVDIITVQLKFIRTLRGLTPNFASLNDGHFDEGRFEQHLEADPRLAIAACWYWIRKLQARFYADDYQSAVAAAAKAEPLLWTAPGHLDQDSYPQHKFVAGGDCARLRLR